jgi:hypothetical protein
MPKLIYLDVCALSRPFDDQHFMRIRLETEAVNLILFKGREEKFSLLMSPVHDAEIRAINDLLSGSNCRQLLMKWAYVRRVI